MYTLPNLPASIAREAYASLCTSLPPLVNDTPEARASRDAEAMASVADLRPANAFETRLAVDVIAADTHAKECLRLAAQNANDITAALRCRAQFAVMMRQMQSALRTLQAIQATRLLAGTTSVPDEDQRTQPATPRTQEAQAIRVPAQPSSASESDPLSAAENYAVLYPLFAARIRVARGLPARLDFTPPDPAIVETLVNGTSPLLCALEQMGDELTEAA